MKIKAHTKSIDPHCKVARVGNLKRRILKRQAAKGDRRQLNKPDDETPKRAIRKRKGWAT